ncbi:aminoglycoside phosphotransferase family protein [Rhodobacteraceae bacterium D3-12]|nr:aminoglycoside phosphotransferase family protein [Rhodobacteraceae bacterium D3-12]
MNVVTTSNIKLYPDQALAALDRLESLLASSPHTAEVTEALRLVPGKRAIFRGTFNGRDAVFRLPLDDKSRTDFAREWAELTRVHAYMATPPLAVVEPLDFDPNTGIFIIAFVPGKPLFTHLRRADPATRLPLLSRAAHWLRAYDTPTLTHQPLDFRRWFRKAAAAGETQPHPDLQDIESRILRRMKRLGRSLHQTDVQTAISHGDFHLNNLLVKGDTLTGIDTGGSGRTPVVKDIARALTHIARRAEPWSGNRHFGVDAAAFHAFTDAFELSTIERDAHLPFMIAFETLIKVEHPDMPQDRLALADKLARGLFRDLRQIT